GRDASRSSPSRCPCGSCAGAGSSWPSRTRPARRCPRRRSSERARRSAGRAVARSRPALPGFLPDTSCMVAAVCGWHQHHERAASEIHRRLRRDEPLIVAGPALVEAYAVLTRLPPPHRVSAPDALAVLLGSFVDAGRVVALDGRSYVSLLRRAPAEDVSGGRTYDAVIAACAL